tara:strand:- start:3262 stop:4218 length:957 start_codon:yes stop_codon:yes gene_type:complete
MLNRILKFIFIIISVYLNFGSEISIMKHHDKLDDYVSPLPSTYIDYNTLPVNFNWGNVNNTNYLTKMLNQHIPRYCGSCWAHAAISALSDRIKIVSHKKGPDINLAIQYVLNCGKDIAGSCHGGSHTGTYQFIKMFGFIPFDTCLSYEACSSDTCYQDDFTCNPINICRTCYTFGGCSQIDFFPNVSISEYGRVKGEKDMMIEIYARGPIACDIDASGLNHYRKGIISYKKNRTFTPDHVVSIVGWGYSKTEDKHYWIIRNSWGEYWGEMGFFRVERGHNLLALEQNCAWVLPDTISYENIPCYENGENCKAEHIQII